jgi:hypothetical protein
MVSYGEEMITSNLNTRHECPKHKPKELSYLEKHPEVFTHKDVRIIS